MTNPHKGRTGFDRLMRATGHSIDGLKCAYTSESAFRQEFWLALGMVPVAFWLSRNWLETVLLIGSVIGVLIVELLNSAVEFAVDRVSFELHPLSKQAKDLASAAVMLSLLLCAGLWASLIWLRLHG
jgi:diacylglycerol kinase (ATP)